MADLKVTIQGLDEFLKMTRRAPADVRRDIRAAGKAVAEPVAATARSLGTSANAQLAATASSIKAVSGTVPKITMGGARRATSSGASMGDVHFGASYGAYEWPQFPGPVDIGRAVWPAVKQHRENIRDSYLDRLEDSFNG